MSVLLCSSDDLWDAYWVVVAVASRGVYVVARLPALLLR